jgi:hypothetical protein
MNRDPMLNVINSIAWAGVSAMILLDIGGAATRPWTYPLGWVFAGIAITRMGDAIVTWWRTA